MNPKKSALGKGLGALLGDAEMDLLSKTTSGQYVPGAIASIPVSMIISNPFQPRSTIEEESLKELAESILQQGIIQPVTVRKTDFDQYQLIAGERRLRAAIIAGLTDIPAYIRVANDQQVLEMALVENIQRENLNVLEIAISYNRLIEECNLTQEQLSERLGKNRTTVTNYLRLLKLPPEIQLALRNNQITMGHARALINIDDLQTQLAILKNIIKKELSVREVEEIVRNLSSDPHEKKKNVKTTLPSRYQKLKDKLNARFHTKIELKRNNNGKGSIVIPFKNDTELNRIILAMKIK